MKNIIITALLLLSGTVSAQVIIGDAIGTAPSTEKESVLLEFANTNNKGIALPIVRTKPSTPALGTLLLDASNLDTTSQPTKARVKYYNGKDMSVDGGWVDLSGQDGNVTAALSQQPVTDAVKAPDTGKSIIGSSTTTADGVLVLESTTRAMVLPIVSDFNAILNPAPGMMALLDKSTSTDTAAVRSTKLRLIVFNGSQWSFWKP